MIADPAALRVELDHSRKAVALNGLIVQKSDGVEELVRAIRDADGFELISRTQVGKYTHVDVRYPYPGLLMGVVFYLDRITVVTICVSESAMDWQDETVERFLGLFRRSVAEIEDPKSWVRIFVGKVLQSGMPHIRVTLPDNDPAALTLH